MLQKRVLLVMVTLVLFSYNRIFAITGFANADYMRTLNRSASVGTIDTMFFNPAGTVRMPDGMYVHVGLELPITTRSFTIPGDLIFGGTGLGLPSGSFGYVYKRAGSSLFFTIMPILSSGLKIVEVPLSLPGIGGKANYDFNEMSYEITAGGAFSFSDLLAMSFGARLITDISVKSIDYSYVTTPVPPTGSGVEQYKNNTFALGVAVHMGLLFTPSPWFAMSLNLHSGGINIGMDFVKSEQRFVGTPVNPSELDGRAQSDGFLVSSSPFRADLGFLFNINDTVQIQLTAQAKVMLFNNNAGTINFDKDKIGFGYSAGFGMDFNLTSSVIWGVGVLFADERVQDASYYTKIESLNVVAMQSLSFGTGFLFSMGDVFDLSISAMYPMYFSLDNGFEIIKFSTPSGAIKEISDIFISIGLSFKMHGLY